MFETESRLWAEAQERKENWEKRKISAVLALYTLATGAATAILFASGSIAESVAFAVPTAITGIGAIRLWRNNEFEEPYSPSCSY